MAQTSFYSEEELWNIGFKSIGKGCMISRKTSLYGVEKMSIGDNVRIDDFCILSGDITLGNNIHISAYVALYGSMGIELEDYTGISARSTIYSAMDDFSGDYLIGPVHPEEYTNVTGGKVTVKNFSQIGSNCVVFPNLTINEGVVVGAMSMVKMDLISWTIYGGVPAKKIKERTRNMLKLTGLNNVMGGGKNYLIFKRLPASYNSYRRLAA